MTIRYLLTLAAAFVASQAFAQPTVKVPEPQRYGGFTFENEDIRFPDQPGVVINVRKPPYNAKGDGVTDDTIAIQTALNDAVATGPNLVYLPDGVYIISDTLKWAGRQTRTVMQGQSERGTIIKLRDRCSGFTDPSAPKELIWTGNFPPQRFRNSIRNLSIDTGKANHGAIGLRFNASNQGVLREVTIRSGDGGGTIGLDMGYTSDVGPLMVKNVTIEGFDVGIYTAFSSAGQVLEGVTLRGQNVYGWVNDGQAVSVRALRTKLSVPALYLKNSGGLFTLIDSQLDGVGAASAHPAIFNQAGLFVRNVGVSGYKLAIENVLDTRRNEAGPYVAEFTSSAPISLFPSPAKSLNLPIEETPEAPWEDPAKWVSVLAHGEPKQVEIEDIVWGKNTTTLKEAIGDNKTFKRKVWDYTEVVQAAIDSGARTIYFPQPPKNKPYTILGTIRVRGNVQRVIGLENTFEANHKGRIPFGGEWIIEDGAARLVTIERFDWIYPNPILRIRTKRPVVFSSIVGPRYDVGEGATVFMDDVVPTLRMEKGSRVWSRQFNTEYTNEARHFIEGEMKRPPHPGAEIESYGNLNDGGTLWILGLKTEGNGTIVSTINGAKTEIIGGLIYSNKMGIPTKKAFIVEEGSLSFSTREMVTRNEPFHPVHETRDGQTKTYPLVSGGLTAPLFTAYKGPSAPAVEAPVAAPLPPGKGSGLTAHVFEDITFSKLKETRVDAAIDFEFAGGEPRSIRWSGYLEPRQTGVHAFPLSSENMRLLIGDTVVNTAWLPPVRYRNGSIALEAGKRYPIVLEYRGREKAKVSLLWSPPGGRQELVPASQLYPATEEPPTVSLIAPRGDMPEGGKMELRLTRSGDTSKPLAVSFLPRVEASMPMQMRFAQRGGAVPGRDYHPLPELVTIPAGKSEVTLVLESIDDKIYEEQRVVIYEPSFSPAYRVAGHAIKVWIKDNDVPTMGSGTGLKGEYFAGRDFTDLQTTRVDERVAFDHRTWDQKVPAPGIDPKKGYSVRWTGEIEPHFSEEYTLKLDTTTYGAARLTLGDTVLIDAQPGNNFRVARIKLEAGKRYPIRIDYDVRNHYSSMAILKWSSASQFEQPVPKTQLYPAP